MAAKDGKGMLKNEHRVCICQKCGEKGSATIWHEIHEKEKTAAMDTSLFKWKCPSCGHIYKFIYPCLYMDTTKKIAVRFQGNDKEFATDKDLSEYLNGYCKRDCSSQEELAEKIRILDAGLDDRAMELLKLLIFAKIHVTDETMEQIQFYREAEDGDFEFTIWTGEGPDGIHIDRQMSENVQELAKELPELEDKYYMIDLDWAGSQVS